jgi:hypothetical protein
MSRRSEGYTVVELMMAISVFATGVTGIIALERATVSSNQLAKNVTVANGIAEAWLSQLAADATLWTSARGVTKTTWLTTITANDGLWQLPTYDDGLGFGAEFDAFGAPTTANPSYCAQIRLTWLYGDQSAQQTTGVAGNGLIRTEVRVFWPRDEATRISGDCNDNSPGTVSNVNTALNNGATYHVVTQAGAVRQPG